MRRTSLAAGVFAIAAAVLAPTPAAPAAGTDHALAVGVVNITHVFRTMSETKKMEADLQARSAGLGQEQRQKEAEVEEMTKHRDENVKPLSAQWNDETAAIDKKRYELEVWTAMNRAGVERAQKQSIKSVYDHIAAAAAKVAEAQHLDLVIADQSPEIGPDLDKATLQQLEGALASRAVLFSNKKADITEDVLTQVDADFHQQNPGAGPVAPPGH